jgi:hypothetical protein
MSRWRAVVGQWRGLARSGLVQTEQASGHFAMLRVCCWWAGGLAALSHACHKRCETWWDGGRYVETISAGRRDGRDGLGRVNTA